MSERHHCGRGVLKFLDCGYEVPIPGNKGLNQKQHVPGRHVGEHNGVPTNNLQKQEHQLTVENHFEEGEEDELLVVNASNMGTTCRDVRNFPTISISWVKNTNPEGKRRILAKYSYQANTKKPGGFDELSMKQGDKLYYLEDHISNPYWIKAEKETGQVGYVPKSYTMFLDTQTGLPWLEEKTKQEKLEAKEQESLFQSSGFGVPAKNGVPHKTAVKPYVSAYNKQSVNSQAPTPKYVCELCAKSFNGPQPYKSHLASKAHKEEEEMQRS